MMPVKAVDTRQCALEIIAVLHRNGVRLHAIPYVFQRVMEEINCNTIPYNPKAESIGGDDDG